MMIIDSFIRSSFIWWNRFNWYDFNSIRPSASSAIIKWYLILSERWGVNWTKSLFDSFYIPLSLIYYLYILCWVRALVSMYGWVCVVCSVCKWALICAQCPCIWAYLICYFLYGIALLNKAKCHIISHLHALPTKQVIICVFVFPFYFAASSQRYAVANNITKMPNAESEAEKGKKNNKIIQTKLQIFNMCTCNELVSLLLDTKKRQKRL